MKNQDSQGEQDGGDASVLEDGVRFTGDQLPELGADWCGSSDRKMGRCLQSREKHGFGKVSLVSHEKDLTLGNS